MIRHIWSVLASRASVDRVSNNVSLFEVLESIQFTASEEIQLPGNVPFDGIIVTLWTREQRDTPVVGEMRVRFLSPTGQELAAMNGQISLDAHVRARTLTRLVGLPIAGNGTHEFEISWRVANNDDWRIASRLPLDITVQVDPGLGAAQQGPGAHVPA